MQNAHTTLWNKWKTDLFKKTKLTAGNMYIWIRDTLLHETNNCISEKIGYVNPGRVICFDFTIKLYKLNDLMTGSATM